MIQQEGPLKLTFSRSPKIAKTLFKSVDSPRAFSNPREKWGCHELFQGSLHILPAISPTTSAPSSCSPDSRSHWQALLVLTNIWFSSLSGRMEDYTSQQTLVRWGHMIRFGQRNVRGNGIHVSS